MKIKKLGMLIALTASQILNAQTIKFDLSKSGTILTQTVSPFELKEIVLENKLTKKGAIYSIDIQLDDVPLTLSTDLVNLGKVLPLDNAATPGNCSKINDLNRKLNDLDKESDIPGTLKELRDAIIAAKDQCKEAIDSSKSIIAETIHKEILSNPLTVKTGQMVTITIKRDTMVWKQIYKTKRLINYTVFYGLSYSLNMMNPIQTYYSKADTGSTYIISKTNNDRKDILTDVSPTILFSFRSNVVYKFDKNPLKAALLANDVYKVGVTVGFSLNRLNLGALITPSIIFGDIFSINFGVGTIRKDVLNGKYLEGDRVKENLSFDQLHEKRIFAEWIISLGFRFDGESFKKNNN